MKRLRGYVIAWILTGAVVGLLMAASQLDTACPVAGETTCRASVLGGGVVLGALLGFLVARMRGYFGR